MSIRELIYHKHYWSIPHSRQPDNKIIQICYDCGRERESPIKLGTREPDPSSGRSRVQPPTVEPDEQTVLTPQQHRIHSEFLEGIAKKLYSKKKLAGS